MTNIGGRVGAEHGNCVCTLTYHANLLLWVFENTPEMEKN